MLNFEERRLVEDLILSLSPRTLGFSPYFIANNLNLPLSDVIETLNILTEYKLIEQYYVVNCPDCTYQLNYKNYYDIPFDQEVECKFGHTIFIKKDMVQVWFKPLKNNRDIKKKRELILY